MCIIKRHIYICIYLSAKPPVACYCYYFLRDVEVSVAGACNFNTYTQHKCIYICDWFIYIVCIIAICFLFCFCSYFYYRYNNK